MTALVRKVSLFRNGRSQAVGIPLVEYLRSKEPLDEGCPTIERSLPRPVDR